MTFPVGVNFVISGHVSLDTVKLKVLRETLGAKLKTIRLLPKVAESFVFSEYQRVSISPPTYRLLSVVLSVASPASLIIFGGILPIISNELSINRY